MTTSATSPEQIAARIERLPMSRWHVKLRVIMGVATFFDAFDALAIAYVLPVLIPLWQLTPGQIGLLIATGFAGQLIGALLFGWLAERYGRVRSAAWSIAIFSVFSIVCALSTSYTSLLLFRFIQGFGLGGQVPVAATYINEIAKAEKRGRFFLLYECIFPVGLMAVALIATWAVPNWGWQSMFIIGALPAILAMVMRRVLPESPRWLASKGRLEEADRVMKSIEEEISKHEGKALPPLPVNIPKVAVIKPSFRDLFAGIYLSRTISVWIMWFCTYFVVYGLSAWLPTIYVRIFKLPVQEALQYSLIATVAGLIGALLCAFFIDRTGRRVWFAGAFLLGAVPLFMLWMGGTSNTPKDVLLLASLSYAAINTLALGLYLYTPEIYPTRVRAIGSGTATAWLRVASILGPILVGAILPTAGLATVFLAFGISAVVGGIVALLFTVETRDKVLEEVSP
jgi:putative MFS transporter